MRTQHGGTSRRPPSGRTLDALEGIAAELERLRMLREHELGVRFQEDEGSIFVMPTEDA